METIKVSCRSCRLRKICLPAGLNDTETKKFETIVQQPRPLQRSQKIFRQGDPFESIYIVRSGTILTYISTGSGEQQVISFNFPGEIVGLNGISNDKFTSTAETIDVSSLCEITFSNLENMSAQIKSLQHHLNRVMSNELLIDQQLLVQISKTNAERRVASFLLNLSDRMHARGFSAVEFNLSMSRVDIGNYLGLAVETVSRQFTHFQDQGIISVSRKRVMINDIHRLRSVADQDDLVSRQSNLVSLAEN